MKSLGLGYACMSGAWADQGPAVPQASGSPAKAGGQWQGLLESQAGRWMQQGDGSVPLASTGPCHGQGASGPLQEAGHPLNPSKPLSCPLAPPQHHRPAARGCLQVSNLLPSLWPYDCPSVSILEATLYWLQLYCMALGTAEGERVPSASFLLLWRTLGQKLAEGHAADVSSVSAASASCSWFALLPVMFPRTRASRASLPCSGPRKPHANPLPTGVDIQSTPWEVAAEEGCTGDNNWHVPVQVISIVSVVRRGKVLSYSQELQHE